MHTPLQLGGTAHSEFPSPHPGRASSRHATGKQDGPQKGLLSLRKQNKKEKNINRVGREAQP